ncbi:hypothetical protein QTP88_026421 [Uroleucon formosanum]
MTSPRNRVEVDPSAQSLTPTTGRRTQSPLEADDLVTESLRQPVTKRTKLAEHGTDSSGSTQAPNGSDWGTNLKVMTDRVKFTILEAVKIICDLIKEYSDNEDVCDSLKNAAVFLRETDKAVSSFLEKNGDVAGTPIPASATTMSNASTNMEITPTKAPAPAIDTSGPKALISSVAKKPPAILIRPGEGKSFADTVRSVRSCGLTAQDMGASVTLRETRNGGLLLELPKGAKSSSAAKMIATMLSGKLGDSVGKVSQLDVQVEIEVLDLDAVSSAAEILEALRAAIPGQDNPVIAAERKGDL